MDSKGLFSALSKLVDAKKATDKAYKRVSKAFFNGTDEELRSAFKELQDEVSKYATASNCALLAASVS